MQRKYVFITAIAAFIGLMVWSPWNNEEASPSPNKKEYNFQTLNANEEIKLKQQILEQDVKLTDELCKTQCISDLSDLLQLTSEMSSSEFKSEALKFQKQHPYMPYIAWYSKGTTAHLGSIPKQQNKTLKSYLSQASASALHGKQYTSKNVKINDQSYYAVGIPSKEDDAFITALVQRDLQENVELHQKKNLRVVPYPSDKRYNIQAADSDDLEKENVDHPEQNEGVSHYHVQQLVVKFKKEPSQQDLKQIQQELNTTQMKKLGYTYMFESSKMNMEEMIHYFKKWDVEYTEPHYLYMTNETAEADQPNDELYASYQWNLPKIDTIEGWDVTKGAEEIIVAVVDTGVDLDHPDLEGRLVEGINIIDEQVPPDDDVGHGTHVAGVIAASVNNLEGIAGMSWYNKIMPVKVLDSTGAGSTYNVAAGIIWAVDHGAKVINLSLGNYAEAQFLHDAVKYAYDKDVVLIAATGNDNTSQPGYPAAYEEVFAVGATNSSEEKAIFSNFGNYVDVTAPGENIASTYPSNRYAALSGTSMASPHVAALAAMIRSVNPSLSNEEVMDIIRETALDLGEEGKDEYYGYGQINVNQALRLASDQNNTSLFLYPQQLEKNLEGIRAQKSAD